VTVSAASVIANQQYPTIRRDVTAVATVSATTIAVTGTTASSVEVAGFIFHVLSIYTQEFW